MSHDPRPTPPGSGSSGKAAAASGEAAVASGEAAVASGEASAPGPTPEAPLADGPPEGSVPVGPDTEPEAGPVEPETEPVAASGKHALEPGLEELVARAAKADEYLELAQRTKADFENYRKRSVRDAGAAEARGLMRLARELLPAVDNLDRALAASRSVNGEQARDTLVSGLKLVHAEVIAALERVGIEQFSPQGERFDPQRHEAMAQQPAEGTEPGTVIEVYQGGYTLGDSVLRPARVVVAGASAAPEAPGDAGDG